MTRCNVEPAVFMVSLPRLGGFVEIHTHRDIIYIYIYIYICTYLFVYIMF